MILPVRENVEVPLEGILKAIRWAEVAKVKDRLEPCLQARPVVGRARLRGSRR